MKSSENIPGALALRSVRLQKVAKATCVLEGFARDTRC